jgi:exopolysaccharide biosynthesis WecB/TagA/CpsF family protein
MTNRFLIVELADIGDLVLSTPALSALREAHPDAYIAVLTTAHSAPILNGTNLADEVITFDKHTFDSPKALLKPANMRRALALARRLRRGKYDTTLFFHHFTTRFGSLKFLALALSAGSKRRIGLDNGNGFFLTERLPDEGFGARHQAQYWLDLVGLVGADTSPRPSVVGMDEDVALPPSTLSGRGAGGKGLKRIAIHAGSGGYSLARRWDADRFAAVADALAKEYGAQIVLVGGAGDDTAAVKDRMQTQPIDLTGKTTLNQLAAVLKTCDLYIGADSGVMHIASAAGVPVVAIFGPSNPAAWGPWTPTGRSIVVSSQPECAPCSYVGHSIGLRNGSEARTCMRMVTGLHVLRAAQELLTPPQPLPVNGEGLPESPLATHMVTAEESANQGKSVTTRQDRDKNAFHPSLLVGEGKGMGGIRRIRVLGLPVDAITYERWLDLIGEWIVERPNGPPRHVCTINPEFIMIARGDPNFYNILNRADLCVPDGVGLLWAAKHLGHPLPERVTGSDGVPKIAERAALEGWRLFLLGAAPGVADKAAEVLQMRYPGLKIVGTYSGSPAPYEEDEIVEQVNASGADILFVAYGAPVQDKWIARNLPRLRPSMAMGVGGSLDFIAGIVPRAPLWMQRTGLEWLFRLYLQPRRIVRMMRLPRFVVAVLLRGHQ